MTRAVTDPTLPDAPASHDRPRGLPGRYRLADVLGTGGMGRVYRAHDSVLGRDVAIKVIETGLPGTVPTTRSDRDGQGVGVGGTNQRERFVREARAAARLAHRNIVAVHDVDPDAGWLVMDLVEGESLKDIAGKGPLPAGKTRAIAEQVLAALDAAHAAGVVHRDIKPSNIIVDAAGKATLVDFGVARLVDAELTKTGESLGTPAYMAPEQLRGARVDERTDLYGLAATLYELVSGERMAAFESPSADAIAKVTAACAGEPGLAYVIERCLQADPARRLASARDALAALGQGRRRRRRWWLVAIPVVAAAAAAAAVVVMRPHGEDPRKVEVLRTAERGQHEKASLLIDEYLVDHPDDADMWAMKVVNDWWKTGRLDDKQIAAIEPKLHTDQRALVRGLALLTQQRDTEAVAFLEDAHREFPDSVGIEYALGEARWHGQFLDRGVATLESAFQHDPSLQMALVHPIEYRLTRGETAALAPIAARLRQVDAPMAAALDCKIAVAEHRYAQAAADARAALDARAVPDLLVCAIQAQILAGNLDAAERSTKEMRERWPLDLREWGGETLANELLLYRGQLGEYLDRGRGQYSTQRTLAIALWTPHDIPAGDPTPPEKAQSTEGKIVYPTSMRAPPLQTAGLLVDQHALGKDPTSLYQGDSQPEVRALGRGLAAELHGDSAGAIAEYRKAVDDSAKGDMRMLAAYFLARALHAAGDAHGAAAACADVIAPRMYEGYRAILLPDCVLWSGDRALWSQELAIWRGDFAHPAIAAMKQAR